MGLLQNLRDRRNQQTRVERNTETLRREFRRELTREDLSDMIRLMDEPEVHKPLFENAEAFGRQPEMDDILRARFQLKALDILGRDSEELESVMSAFNEGSDTYETDQDTRRLSDKLLLAEQDEYVSVKDRITNRIRTTRQDINDRVDYQQEKVRNKFRSIDRSIERRVRPLVDVAQDSVKGMLQGVKDRVQSFKDDYRTRQITIENAQNWEMALEKGVSAEQIESVIEHADYPEVRYGVMKHASALFEQDAMTPELATELFYAYQPHTNAQNEMHENFYNQLETYANTVVEQTEKKAEKNELSVSPEEYAQSVEARKESVRETIEETPLEGDASKDYFFNEYGAEGNMEFEDSFVFSELMRRNGIGTLHDLPRTDEGSYLSDDEAAVIIEQHKKAIDAHIDTLHDLPRTDEGLDARQAQLLGITNEGDTVWGVPDNGEIRHLSDDEVSAVFMEQYGKAIDAQNISSQLEGDSSKDYWLSNYGDDDVVEFENSHTLLRSEGDSSKDYWLSNYGDDDVVEFENSHTLLRLMSRNGIDTLPDLPRTDEGLDVRQAQLLGISSEGNAVWGVPVNGEIRHLSDDELEDTFMSQYGKTLDPNDILPPLEYLHSEYGAEGVVTFEDSSMYSRFMHRNGIDTLPDLPRTDEGLDVRQAQLLGISNEGGAIWGVPVNGEIRHLSDDELEDAFMEQYGKTLDTQSPDQSDAPVEDESYNFYDSLAREFNQQWDDEAELMASSAPLPDEHDAPPLPDEDDIPPLSFEGLEEQQQQQM